MSTILLHKCVLLSSLVCRTHSRSATLHNITEKVQVSDYVSSPALHKAHASVREDDLLQVTRVVRLCLTTGKVVDFDAARAGRVPCVCLCVIILHCTCTSEERCPLAGKKASSQPSSLTTDISTVRVQRCYVLNSNFTFLESCGHVLACKILVYVYCDRGKRMHGITEQRRHLSATHAKTELCMPETVFSQALSSPPTTALLSWQVCLWVVKISLV